MSIKATENRTSQKSTNWMTVGALGATAGYSTKYLLPVTTAEKDEQFTKALAKVKLIAKSEKDKAIEAIGNSKKAYADEFVSTLKAKQMTADTIKKLNRNKKEQFLAFISELNDVSRAAKAEGIKNVKTMTKQLRPSATFAFIGMTLAYTASFCKDAYNNVAKS